MTKWTNLNFCTYFVPMSEYKEDGWVNIINLKRATTRHPNRIVIAWYNSKPDNIIPPSFAQDERVFYYMKYFYNLISFSIKTKARTIFEHRLELLKEITPSIINHEILTNLKASLSSFKHISNELKKENIKESILESISSNIKMLEYAYSVADSILKITKRVKVEDVYTDKLFGVIYNLTYNKLATESGCLNIDSKKRYMIRSDSSLLIQLLLNLVINSIEAYKDTDIEYDRKIYLSAKEIDENYIEIYVSDFAKEIDENLKEKIFEQGFTTKREGHGLGLTICRYIANFLGGELFLKKFQNFKTTLVIKLPKESDKINELEEEVLYG